MENTANKLTNFYTKIKKKTDYYNPNMADGAPVHPFNMLIVGKSGSMKTNSLLNIVDKCACFTKIYLLARLIDEPLYEFLAEKLEGIASLENGPLLTKSNSLNDIPKLEDLDKTDQILLVLDDMIGHGKKKLTESLSDHYIRGRKFNMSIIFITQSFYDVPLILRHQFNYLVLKKISNQKELKSICRYAGLDHDDIIALITKIQDDEPSSFFMIDQKTGDENLKYRVNFEKIPEKYRQLIKN